MPPSRQSSHQPSIRHALAQWPLKVINRANDGPNTYHTGWPQINTWTPWADFNAPTLYSMFSEIVDAKWDNIPDCMFPHQNRMSTWHEEIYDEDDLEHTILTPLIMNIVNEALTHGLSVANMASPNEHLAIRRGGRTSIDEACRPDWGLCSWVRRDGPENNYRHLCMMPGDSKLSNKWESNVQEGSWNFPIQQVGQYCRNLNTRYGFLITDAELVVLRMTPQYTSAVSHVALGKAPRQQQTQEQQQQQQQGHARQTSTATDVSQISEGLQSLRVSSAGSGSSYRPTSRGTDGFSFEYRAVPMTAKGDGKTSLNLPLALFYLAWMAGVGMNNQLAPEYPSLNSYWPDLTGKLVHNSTSCYYKDKGAAKLERPDSAAPCVPDWITVEGAGESESFTVMTLATVRYLPVARDEENGGEMMHYYYDDVGNRRVFITPGTYVYDEDEEVYGVFDGLTWKPGRAGAASSSSSRARAGGASKKKRTGSSSMKHGPSSKRR